MSKSRENDKISTFSRRQFLKILSLEVGLIALSGCRTTRLTQSPNDITQSPIAIPPGDAPPVKSTIPPSNTSPVKSNQTPTSTPTMTSTSLPTTVAEPTFLPNIRNVGETYSLPQPGQSNNTLLMNALANRRTTRTFLPDDLPVAVLSDLLWAGFGVNRPESGRRTAPSARNMQDIHIYVACASGLWLYEAQQNKLTAILADDVRPLTQPPSGDRFEAPVQLIYVSRYPAGVPDTEMVPWSWAHTGFVSQNVYLYCAAMDLATVVRYAVSRPPLAERMGLQKDEHITLVQSVGWRA